MSDWLERLRYAGNQMDINPSEENLAELQRLLGIRLADVSDLGASAPAPPQPNRLQRIRERVAHFTEMARAHLNQRLAGEQVLEDAHEAFEELVHDVACDVPFVLERLAAAEARAAKAERENREVCICAAVRLQDGRIIRGHRHDDCILTAIKLKVVDYVTQDSQGFVTSRNRFVGRAEGATLQNAAGLTSKHYDGPINSMLFSEDLY